MDELERKQTMTVLQYITTLKDTTALLMSALPRYGDT